MQKCTEAIVKWAVEGEEAGWRPSLESKLCTQGEPVVWIQKVDIFSDMSYFKPVFFFLVLDLALLFGELPIVLNQFVMWWLWVLWATYVCDNITEFGQF